MTKYHRNINEKKYRSSLILGGNKIATNLINDIKDDISDAIKASNIESTISIIINDINDVAMKNEKIEEIIENNEGIDVIKQKNINKIEKLFSEIDVKLTNIEKRDAKMEKLSRNIIKKIGDANIEPVVKKLVAGATGEIIPAFDAYVNECNNQHKINIESIKRTFGESFEKFEPLDIMTTRNLINEMTFKHESFLKVLKKKREKIITLVESFSNHNLVIPFSTRQDIEFILTDSFIPLIAEIVKNTILISGLTYATIHMFYYSGTWIMFRSHLFATYGLTSPTTELSLLNIVRNKMLKSTYAGGSK